jgi:hypothetical protein
MNFNPPKLFVDLLFFVIKRLIMLRDSFYKIVIGWRVLYEILLESNSLSIKSHRLSLEFFMLYEPKTRVL